MPSIGTSGSVPLTRQLRNLVRQVCHLFSKLLKLCVYMNICNYLGQWSIDDRQVSEYCAQNRWHPTSELCVSAGSCSAQCALSPRPQGVSPAFVSMAAVIKTHGRGDGEIHHYCSDSTRYSDVWNHPGLPMFPPHPLCHSYSVSRSAVSQSFPTSLGYWPNVVVAVVRSNPKRMRKVVKFTKSNQSFHWRDRATWCVPVTHSPLLQLRLRWPRSC